MNTKSLEKARTVGIVSGILFGLGSAIPGVFSACPCCSLFTNVIVWVGAIFFGSVAGLVSAIVADWTRISYDRGIGTGAQLGLRSGAISGFIGGAITTAAVALSWMGLLGAVGSDIQEADASADAALSGFAWVAIQAAVNLILIPLSAALPGAFWGVIVGAIRRRQDGMEEIEEPSLKKLPPTVVVGTPSEEQGPSSISALERTGNVWSSIQEWSSHFRDFLRQILTLLVEKGEKTKGFLQKPEVKKYLPLAALLTAMIAIGATFWVVIYFLVLDRQPQTASAAEPASKNDFRLETEAGLYPPIRSKKRTTSSPATTRLEILHPQQILASSFLIGDGRYPPRQAFDGNLRTAWAEGVSNPGRGEWIEARFSPPRHIREIYLTTGYEKRHPRSGDLFYLNSHLRQLRVEFDGGQPVVRDIDRHQRHLTIEELNVKASRVRFIATRVWLGTRWQDLSISEIRIKGEVLTPSFPEQASAEVESESGYYPVPVDENTTRVMARISNADDKVRIYVNGEESVVTEWGKGPGGRSIGHRPGDSGWVNITPRLLASEDNQLRFWVWNAACCGASGRFEVKVNNKLVVTRNFKRTQDPTLGVRYNETVSLKLPQ